MGCYNSKSHKTTKQFGTTQYYLNKQFHANRTSVQSDMTALPPQPEKRSSSHNNINKYVKPEKIRNQEMLHKVNKIIFVLKNQGFTGLSYEQLEQLEQIQRELGDYSYLPLLHQLALYKYQQLFKLENTDLFPKYTPNQVIDLDYYHHHTIDDDEIALGMDHQSFKSENIINGLGKTKQQKQLYSQQFVQYKKQQDNLIKENQVQSHHSLLKKEFHIDDKFKANNPLFKRREHMHHEV